MRQQDELMESKPMMIFPDECQINTRQHINKYAKHISNKFNKSKYRIPNKLEELKLDELYITDDNKLELIAGVGCYFNQENNIKIDEKKTIQKKPI